MPLDRRQRRAIARWRTGSSVTYKLLSHGIVRLCVVVMTGLNRLEIDGLDRFLALRRRGDRGLLTYSNHVTLLDDPLVLANLGLTRFSYREIRWVAADALRLFGNAVTAWTFSAGKCVPIARGAGIDQPGMHFLAERLRAGDWVHVFPEGGTNPVAAPRLRPFKTGVGWLIARARPLVLPFYHFGLERVFTPDKRLRAGREVEVLFGEPVDCDAGFVARWEDGHSPGARRDRELWQRISDWAHGLLAELETRVVPEEPAKREAPALEAVAGP